MLQIARAILLFTLVLPVSLEAAGEALSPGAALPAFEVDLTEDSTLDLLGELGLDLLEIRPGFRGLVLGWPGTEERLVEAGIPFISLSRDYGKLIAERNRVSDHGGDLPLGAGAAFGAVPPEGFGSLAGFWTYDEVCALLDSLATHDGAGILTGVDTIGVSLEGRPILALGVMAETQPAGTRPEVLFTALTHSREPGGMQTILHFLLRLVEGYGVDPELTYLVDHREIWFVPVVNPDGYLRNEQTFLDTGSYGFWRKNLRDNDGNSIINGNDGVDLNRNFGYEWGYDDQGSSPFINTPTYRGPAPFSEPETQVLRDFCLAHAFVTANNYHTYWEATLYPWAHKPEDSPDASFFLPLVDRVTRDNRYAYGFSDQVLYPVNGDADDWMYGEQVLKPKVFAITSEVGRLDDGFWPPASRILPLAVQNFSANVVLSYAAGLHLVADSLTFETADGSLPIGAVTPATLRLTHLGAGGSPSGEALVTVTSSDAGVTVVDGTASYPALLPLESSWPTGGGGFLFSVDPSAVPGSVVKLHLEITDGADYIGRDTLTVRLGTPMQVFAADGGDLGGWTPLNGWGIEVVEGDSVFSDSPSGNYSNYAAGRLTLDVPLDLSGGDAAVLRFRSRFEIEGGYDFGLAEASSDSGATWIPLQGRFTKPGHGSSASYGGGVQPLGQPGYEGTRRLWVSEELDLTPFAGQPDVRLRFRMLSDGGVTMDGWLIDDLRVLVYAPETSLAAADGGVAVLPAVSLRPGFPNPFLHQTRIAYSVPAATPVRVSVFDLHGRLLRVLSEGYTEAGEKSLVWDGTGDDGRPVSAGTYFVRVETGRGSAATKVQILR